MIPAAHSATHVATRREQVGQATSPGVADADAKATLSVASKPRSSRWQVAIGAVALVLIVVGGLVWRQTPPAPAAPAAVAQPATNAVPAGIVELPPPRHTEAGIQLETLRPSSLQLTRRVPGRVAHNLNRVVEIRATAKCVVQSNSANVGDSVRKGQPLLVLSSSDVGLARDAVLHDEAELRLAQQAFDWSRQTGVNVQELVASFHKRPSMTEVVELFADKPLGAHREQIIAAYSRLQLAEAGAEQLQAAETAGAVSQRLASERRSEREVAAAAFRSVTEQSKFAVKQQQDRDRAALDQAARRVAISRERLTALVGPYADSQPVSDSPSIEYSKLTIRAPWNATVDARPVVASSNVAAADPLITLVDLDTVWINAELFEHDYAAVDLSKIRELTALVPAVSDQPQTATVRFTSTGVANQTQAIALVAELPNESRRYRPGMFAWIELPAETKTNVLAVPAGAIVRQDGETYVFVADSESRFRRVDVELGVETPDHVEIRRGLSAGDRVVTAGTFTLKSELLLAAESGDE
ncbi:MAG: efflux RND transporter periplasmic adaptor subunit [Planctomycetaceae bacterium]|nr:efflux RND transporter periplasmic adaptor subunit [Planctomycetaceae bacterium]